MRVSIVPVVQQFPHQNSYDHNLNEFRNRSRPHHDISVNTTPNGTAAIRNKEERTASNLTAPHRGGTTKKKKHSDTVVPREQRWFVLYQHHAAQITQGFGASEWAGQGGRASLTCSYRYSGISPSQHGIFHVEGEFLSRINLGYLHQHRNILGIKSANALSGRGVLLCSFPKKSHSQNMKSRVNTAHLQFVRIPRFYNMWF